MLKYTEAVVGFSEVPDEIALCINISGCPIHCEGCHSPYLWEDIGEELNSTVLSKLIAKNKGITCVAFMGGDANPEDVLELAKWVKNNTTLKVCWYSGRYLKDIKSYAYLDYFKEGPYQKDKGGLDKPTTNQVFYSIHPAGPEGQYWVYDITFKFRNNETSNKSESAG